MTRAGYLSRGLERFLFAMDSVYRKMCPTQSGLCLEFYENGRQMILSQLKKTNVEDDVDIYEFLHVGNDEYEYRTIGNWSVSGGLRLHSLYRSFFDGPVESKCQPPMCKCFLDGDFFQGNQSLGISLLVGIITLYITAYFFVFDATDAVRIVSFLLIFLLSMERVKVCRLRVVMHGFGYSLCFGVMIAKATQLRNAETLGFGTSVHISFWNYWLLLFFIIGVQIALNTRWVAEPFMSTLAVSDTQSEMVCTLGREEFVLANIYVVILLFLALFINSRNRNIKRNYKETKWLFVSSLLCTFIWFTWIALYFVVPNEYKETVIVLELISCSSILLGLLFGPKIYILLSYEPVVVEFKQDSAQQGNNMTLFERDDDLPSIRAVSPASSGGSTRTASSMRGAKIQPPNVLYQDEQSPIFHTVMRKKNKVRRSHSEHELSEQVS
ncbi:unnamed protein product [Strongylus vulgaris]|uniref:G-protein coupled receptors family 3 profile domain-containing protein n=1 Tax=Strongylus vulgaris TaxID=40348 RepID=A0A3P7LH02_STRVU|nr:unnamed protein product [Strongylus vulgaris]